MLGCMQIEVRRSLLLDHIMYNHFIGYLLFPKILIVKKQALPDKTFSRHRPPFYSRRVFRHQTHATSDESATEWSLSTSTSGRLCDS